MSRIVLASTLVLLLAAAASAVEHRDLIFVEGAARADAPGFEECGIIINDVGPEGIRAEATARQQELLRGIGCTVRVLTPDIDLVYQANSRTFGTDAGAWYMPYVNYIDTMITIAQNNSSFIKLETLGLSIAHRPLITMKFSDNPRVHENEPAVHFEGNIHGDEKIGWAILMEMVKYLASGYGSDTLVTRLIDEREIWLLPMVNPDGYERSRRYNDANVDLNRNWGWMWQNGSTRGSGPMSEPESRAQLGHILRHPLAVYISYHAGTEFISHPWSYCLSRINTIPELPLIQFLSARYDHYTHYTYGQGADSMYNINGSTKDFNYGYDGSMGWSIEVHYSKTPPASEIVPTFNENLGAILELFHHAGKGIHGTVTDAATDRPVHAQILVSPAGWHSYTDPTLGDYHRFYLPGTYSLTFRAPGYRDTTIADVVVPNSADSSVTVDVQLVPDTTAPLFGFRTMYSFYVNDSTNRTYPVRATGPHDGVGYQLDQGKYVCIDLDRPVRNLPGNDLIVYRSSGSGTAAVKGATAWDGAWTTIGTASSSAASFDIGSVGMDSVRFIRLEATSTFLFDAVEGANYTGLDEGPRRSVVGPVVLSASQNPARGPVHFNLNRPVDDVRVQVLDLNGRVVRAFDALASFTWDRTDNAGRRVAAGVYFARLEAHDVAPVRIVLAE